jgi:hypothetical protein
MHPTPTDPANTPLPGLPLELSNQRITGCKKDDPIV